jgi:uncharacterized LabA/DUF88 family protein
VSDQPARVVVFIDYQNVYRGAQRAFRTEFPTSQDGQIDPYAVAQRIVSERQWPSVLASVRVYRGRPDSTRDPRGYGANLRQCTAWESSGVDVTWRTLRYPQDWPAEPAEEKGIDVALAIDFVMMAFRKDYDVGVLMSTDTDLKPALEAIRQLGRTSPFPRCEVAAWSSSAGHSRRLSLAGRGIWCHWLDESAYDAVHDPRDYNIAS